MSFNEGLRQLKMKENKIKTKLQEKSIQKQVEFMNKYHEMNEQFKKDMTKAIRQSMKNQKDQIPQSLKNSLKQMEKSQKFPKINYRMKK